MSRPGQCWAVVQQEELFGGARAVLGGECSQDSSTLNKTSGLFLPLVLALTFCCRSLRIELMY